MAVDQSFSCESYKIPDEIMSRIPSYFWAAFGGELASVFSLSVFEADEDGLTGLDYIGGTGGWTYAFKATCKKLKLKWLWKYYDKLTWWESDMFDGEIADLVQKQFGSAEKTESKKAYYEYICRW